MSRHTHEEKTTLFVLEMEGMTAWYLRGEVEVEAWRDAALRVADRYSLSTGHVRAIAFRKDPKLYQAIAA